MTNEDSIRDHSLTAKTVSRWLWQSGTLSRGTVLKIKVELDIKTTISRLIFLTATYSTDSPFDLPLQLVVKSPLVAPHRSDEFEGEINFYRQLAPMLGTPPTVRCLAAFEESDGYSETLVLEDLRATHDHPPWPIPPSRKQCELALDALIRLHAQWWESSKLGRTIGQPHTPESLRTMVQRIGTQIPDFFDSLGGSLPKDARPIYESAFDSLLRPWMRLTDSRALTIIHGDAHTWNFLYPRAGQGPAFLIDWQLWHVDVGARDLAFLMALHWYPSLRRELEEPLLRYYYEGLRAHGIDNYSFDDLRLDYRRCVVRNLTIPILFWSRGMEPEGWWHRLECALAAYRDLKCEELL